MLPMVLIFPFFLGGGEGGERWLIALHFYIMERSHFLEVSKTVSLRNHTCTHLVT